MDQTQLDYLDGLLGRRKLDDLGCGKSKLLPFIIGIDYLGLDKEDFSKFYHLQDSKVNFLQHDLTVPCTKLRHDIALVSWPINRRAIPWEEILPPYKDIIYLGSNHGGSCCGEPQMWNMLKEFKVIKAIPAQAEILIHYRPEPRGPHELTPREEHNAIAAWNGGGIAEYSEEPYLPG